MKIIKNGNDEYAVTRRRWLFRESVNFAGTWMPWMNWHTKETAEKVALLALYREVAR
jgi:hypothetical protein